MAASLSSACVTVRNKKLLFLSLRRILSPYLSPYLSPHLSPYLSPHLSPHFLSQTHSSSDGGGFSVTESTDEFRYVERLIPPSRVPSPPKHTGPAPSGWAPPSETPPSMSYMIRRSRMHNIPVYSDIKHGSQKSTLVRKVEGDIWALDKDVKEHLRQLTGREPPTKVNEVTMSIRIKGQFDTELKEWLLRRGF